MGGWWWVYTNVYCGTVLSIVVSLFSSFCVVFFMIIIIVRNVMTVSPWQPGLLQYALSSVVYILGKT